jgi:phospholipid/cholesterol/gamma-HCH transport system ATP-binding protein
MIPLDSHSTESEAAGIAAPQPVVEVRDLDAYYGRRKILHGINLTVRQGDIVVIMGGSGSGKSTLLRHLVGLERPARGTVRLLGGDINEMPAMELVKLRRKIGVAFQGGALFSSLNVAENIKLPLREHTDVNEKTMDIVARMKLEVVNLSGFGDLMPAELSGGMLKRAAVARAIVMDPSLLFFDEPSAGLDPVISSALDDLILQLRAAMDMTIVVVTHEVPSAFKIADRIIILDQGCILADDSTDGIRESSDPRIQDFLNRRAKTEDLDAVEYLRRLTGDA